MRIDRAGNVGIGTNDPGATLQIGGGTASVLQKIHGAVTAGIQIFTGSGDGSKIASLEQYFSNEGSLFLFLSGTTKVLLRANADSYLNGGKVGIGITSPTAKLHVSDSINGGSIKVAGAVTDTSANYYGFMHDASDLQGTTQVNTFYSGGAIKANTTITDYAGIRIDTPSVSATSAAVTNNYGVYQSSSLQKNYFAGKIGIGTSSPAANLDVVVSNVSVTPNGNSSAVFRQNANNYITILSGTNNEGGLLFGNSADAADGWIAYQNGSGNQFIGFGTANSEKMRITSSGNVGIGTSNPGHKLHLAGSNKDLDGIQSAINSILIEDTNTGVSAGEPVGGILFKQNDGTTTAGVTAFIGAQHGSTDGDTNLLFAAGPGGGEPPERMTISSAGNVGIGTTVPLFKFQVEGIPPATNGALINIRNSAATTTNTTFGGIYFNSAPGNDFSIGKSNVNSVTTLSFRNGNTGASLIDVSPSGNVGIGTTTPSSLLHLSSASSPTLRIVDTTNDVTLLAFAQDSSAGFGTFSAHQLNFYVNSSAAMVIDGSQNVGIGLTADVGKLGTVNFGGVRLHIKGSGNIARAALEGTVQATVLMRVSGTTASADSKIKFIQSKGGEYRMGSVDDDGGERTQLSIENNGDTHIESGDLEVDTANKGLILKSANGNRFRITVDNGGTLISTQMG
tara:strand:- start:283 stop:2316 length:2034 start_codon:yes stop_codon:yes gene_type:complete